MTCSSLKIPTAPSAGAPAGGSMRQTRRYAGSGAGRRLLDFLLEWHEQVRQRRALEALDDRLLRDIGLTRAEVERGRHKFPATGRRIVPTAVSGATLSAWLSDGVAPVIVDVRRPHAYAAADSVLPGASWRDPASVASWSEALPRGRRVVVYCVHGHEVGQEAAAELRRRGFDARHLEGGIESWIAARHPTVAKP